MSSTGNETTPSPSQTSSSELFVDFFAGWCSGAAAIILCQPVDTVLTRLQASSILTRNVSAGLQGVGIASVVNGAATMELQGLVSRAGATSLWRGSAPMVSAVPLQNALLMGGYGWGKRLSGDGQEDGKDKDTNDQLLGVFIGGCTGGVVQSFLMSPVELVKTRQQVAGRNMMTALSSVSRGVFSTSKSTSAWRGLNATLLRDGIPHGVWFVSYEMCKRRLETYYSEKDRYASTDTQSSFVVPLVSGAYAATVAWAVGYPFDIIKTRIQAGTSNGGIVSTTQDIIRESEGHVFRGLYRGFGLKLMRAIPSSAIGFLVYEKVSACFS